MYWKNEKGEWPGFFLFTDLSPKNDGSLAKMSLFYCFFGFRTASLLTKTLTYTFTSYIESS